MSNYIDDSEGEEIAVMLLGDFRVNLFIHPSVHPFSQSSFHLSSIFQVLTMCQTLSWVLLMQLVNKTNTDPWEYLRRFWTLPSRRKVGRGQASLLSML